MVSDIYKLPVIILHGLGARPWTLKGIEWLLQWQGFERVFALAYPADTHSFDQCLAHVDKALSELFDDNNQKLLIVGQSMGGVIGAHLHTYGWKIECLVTIGSPLHGASMLSYAFERIPSALSCALMKPNYEYLMQQETTPKPPHACHCITMSWPLLDFDGCVFVEEARFTSCPHTHLAWADHRTVFANPRLWLSVSAALTNHVNIESL